jgi:hypothetical protein
VISGDETWGQAARQFLSGSVEVRTADGEPLVADATLTLPIGRYKRWIWNNTAGGKSLLVRCATTVITIPSGMAAGVQCTGHEMVRRTSDVTSAPMRRVLANANADYTPTVEEAASRILESANVAIGAARSIELPNIDGIEKIVFNNSSDNFALTFKVNGETGVAVAQGKRAIIYCDGTDYVRVTPDT